jgi:NAD(P)-dependent dehydrogenase (short-subunit alcohol dehydrogenase family)
VIEPELVRGRVVVITGASRGIGAGVAAAYRAAGAHLGLCARTPIPAGDGAVTAGLDVTDAAAVARFADEVASRLGPIDLWINNAGVLEPIGPLADIELAAFARHLEVDLVGVFAGTQAYLRHRRRIGPGGVLVNISSGAARHAYAGWSAYCASKAAVDRLSECVALEEAGRGLRVHAVAPGIVDTAMQAQIRATSAERFPAVGKFLRLAAEGGFSTLPWVAARLAELVFDPDHRTDEVLVELALEFPPTDDG